MRVTVKRDSGLIAIASKFQLMVDGEKVPKINDKYKPPYRVTKSLNREVLFLLIIYIFF